MLEQNIQSELLLNLSTEEQYLIVGGKFTPYIISQPGAGIIGVTDDVVIPHQTGIVDPIDNVVSPSNLVTLDNGTNVINVDNNKCKKNGNPVLSSEGKPGLRVIFSK